MLSGVQAIDKGSCMRLTPPLRSACSIVALATALLALSSPARLKERVAVVRSNE
jgi:hypothetical protein